MLEATVEEVLGTGGRVSWVEQGEEPVELQDCLRASLMLLLTDCVPLTTTFIRILKHHRVSLVNEKHITISLIFAMF